MIAEAWQWLTTPATAQARRLGFLKESIAMQARFQRCRSDWQPHYQRCQQVIREAMAQAGQQRVLLIMGAGLLEDIPLAEASERFEQVWLVDMVFLRKARRRAAAFANVRLIEADITESLTTLANGQDDVARPRRWLDQPVDCVVSLNLLTQLPMVPVRSRLKRSSKDHDAQLETLGKALIEAHLAYLSRFSGVRCLICDRWVEERRADARLVDELDPAWDVALPSTVREWDWTVIPFGESAEAPRNERIHRVGASVW
ncbi:MAG: hypothetical protein RI556_05555 [Hydrogenovibrio sp.]|uniref:hypothetical protein n=1 Tax=Hydrogenovibrio sp. TaxID=2065821 RepID=UPI0028704803|nr:hypothetical protein [Hydrogenovibrio sp.]MDR9498620.1 hypothetical protein [Hydrogenovibrio sp.]